MQFINKKNAKVAASVSKGSGIKTEEYHDFIITFTCYAFLQ